MTRPFMITEKKTGRKVLLESPCVLCVFTTRKGDTVIQMRRRLFFTRSRFICLESIEQIGELLRKC